MRRAQTLAKSLLVLAFVFTVAGEPATASPPVAPRSPARASKPVPAPIPRPSPCADYSALEAGKGTPPRQDWFNHLGYQEYAQVRMRCVYPQWGPAEWPCLRQLWQEESSWRPTAGTQPNGSYGIAQFFPARKYAAYGADWRTNGRTQIRAGLDYIAKRYGRVTRASMRGRPCRAGY